MKEIFFCFAGIFSGIAGIYAGTQSCPFSSNRLITALRSLSKNFYMVLYIDYYLIFYKWLRFGQDGLRVNRPHWNRYHLSVLLLLFHLPRLFLKIWPSTVT